MSNQGIIVKSQFDQIKKLIQSSHSHFWSIQEVCFGVNETDLILGQLLQLLGLVSVKVDLGWHGESYNQSHYFFINQSEIPQLESLKSKED